MEEKKKLKDKLQNNNKECGMVEEVTKERKKKNRNEMET